MNQEMHNAFEHLKHQIKELDIFKVIHNDNSDLLAIKYKLISCDKIIVLGTGGSSLGGKCLVKYHCYLNNANERVVFLENVDARTFNNVISKCNPNTTGIVVISKSGSTTEPLVLFETIRVVWPTFDHKNNTIVITELSEQNPLLSIARKLEVTVLEHNKNIGGRFSVFSNVGLLPALLNGVDINSLLHGAKLTIDGILSSDTIEDCSYVYDICMVNKTFDTKYEHVLMCYSDGLIEFGKWYNQLLSESIGKNGFGITPISSIGTIDQHSLLQLFLGGPRNKVFTIVIQNNQDSTPAINSEYGIINKKTIADLMIAHQNATIDAIKSVASVRVLSFDQFDMSTMGFLMMLSFVEILVIAKIRDINPFDQPSVEKQKELLKLELTKTA